MTTPIKSVSAERLDEMLAGLEGVTPGPWQRATNDDTLVLTTALDADGNATMVADVLCSTGQAALKDFANAAHIARCDPDTIRALIEEVQQSRRAANTTAGALSAAQFEHEVTQQTQAYEFKEGPNGEWLFRCDEWFNLSAVLDALSALPAGEGEDVTSEQVLNVAGRIQSIMSEKLSVDEGEIMGVGPASYKIARLFKPAPTIQAGGDEPVAWKGDRALADVRRLMAEAKDEVEPIVGGPEGETIMAYKIPTGLWLMLQARVRNMLDHLPPPTRPATPVSAEVTVTEPVAWRLEADHCEPIYTANERLVEYGKVQGWNVAPLYTHPQSTPPVSEGVTPTHRHKKRGTEYVLIGIGKMQAEDWHVLLDGEGPITGSDLLTVDMREVAIYRSVTDPTEIWVRPREEFEDGRFEALASRNAPSTGEME